jgi:hypothetical protein
MKKRKRSSPKIERPADISDLISGYEKDSREAEAKLFDDRKKAARKAKAKPLNE